MSTDNSSEEWISQAEAARLRGVSRQAISKLIRQGKLRTFEIGGHVLVDRAEILGPRGDAGRPRVGEDRTLARILRGLAESDVETRRAVFEVLRAEFPIHPLEARLGVPAELLMEAIARAGPLTLRGIRGVLAEAAFEVRVLRGLDGWSRLPVAGDPSFDYLLDDGRGAIRIQVKLQRQKAGRPMMASEGYRRLSSEMFVVETQRTRGGRDFRGEDTRPYRFGDFDVLAVAMEPSAGTWDAFLYTVADWLMPRPDDIGRLLKFQPVPRESNADWTHDFGTCVQWFRSRVRKTIGGRDGDPSAR